MRVTAQHVEIRKIAAFLVADVVGSSRLSGADEDRTLSRLRAPRSDLIDPAIADHHGHIVKRTGNGIPIEFRGLVDAVRCPVEVQNGLIERNAGGAARRRRLATPIFDIKPLRNRLRANKARQGTLVQSNMGGAGN